MGEHLSGLIRELVRMSLYYSLLGVVDTGLLEYLSADGHSRVDWVGDDAEVSLGGDLGSNLGKVTDDGSIGLAEGEGWERRIYQLSALSRQLACCITQFTHVEQVVTGHSWLSGNSSRDDNDFGTLQSLLEASLGSIWGVAGGLRLQSQQKRPHYRSVRAPRC